jgi:hypothetical protein
VTAQAYPLTWPAGWPRARSRDEAPFHKKKDTGRGYSDHVAITMAQARTMLQAELDRLGAREIVLSTNVELNLNGDPRGDRARPGDVGVACYFKLKGRDTVLACDKWLRVEDNIVAISKHIDALRGQERWGVGTVEQAFTGYQALPAPIAKRHWTAVFGLSADASRDAITAAYRSAAKNAGMDQKLLLTLNLARDEALAERTLGA